MIGIWKPIPFGSIPTNPNTAIFNHTGYGTRALVFALERLISNLKFPGLMFRD